MAELKLTAKDFKSDQEVRWCPGCGDYAILATVQSLMPELGVPPERTVFVSGIGCAGRFVYYMDTYGMHGIHGRAPALATGLAVSRPDLSVWVVTGDGDSLSIGGNHLIHALRRNVPVKILLFNNQIYGLTKGQYSPTSEQGKVTKSTPFGSQDHPFNPLALALGAEATFVARAVDTDRNHVADVLRAAAEHQGTAFVEIYQNCNIFNDGAFDILKDPETRDAAVIRLEHDQPIVFGADGEKCVVREPRGFGLQVARTARSRSSTWQTWGRTRSWSTTPSTATPASPSRSPTSPSAPPGRRPWACSARCRAPRTRRGSTRNSRKRASRWATRSSRSFWAAATPGRFQARSCESGRAGRVLTSGSSAPRRRRSRS